MTNIGEILKSARIAKNLERADLASALGIHLDEMVSAENGSSLQADTLYALVNYLNVDPELVLNYIESRNWVCSTDEEVENLVQTGS
ncbi:MAG: XRE family transcriptional regulator [Proteobacteria bacterium]|nr:MAG: XRE family transcriptional regulator [Pseudomonadota bacterium]